jgi:nitrile hydratase accessory protein
MITETPVFETRVFREPWEATAFAIVVSLHKAGHFTWTEWTDTLADEIRAAQAAGDADLGDTYYRHWLAALEQLIAAKNLADPVDLHLRELEVMANARKHIHKARREPLTVA